MAITISGENNNDRITAQDGVIDTISGFNISGIITASSFTGDLTGDVTGNITGNVTGNINNTTLLLQTGGYERVRIASDGVITGRGELRLTQGNSTVSNGSEIGSLMYTYPSNDNKNAKIVALSNGGSSGADLAFFTRTQGDASNTDGGTEKLRITSGGKVCVAHDGVLHSGNLQVSTDAADAIDINAYSSTAGNGGRLSFYRSKNATIGSNTIVVDNDSLGRIDFRGYNTSGNSYNQGATIEAVVDGSVNSSTDMPTAILFKTSADGSSSPSERLRIESGGDVGVGTDIALARLDVYKGTSATDVDIFSVRSKTGAFNIQCSDTDAANPEWRLRTYYNEDLVFSPGGTGSSGEKVRITSAGLFGIGVTPISIFHVRPLDETNFLVRNEGSTVVLASETNNGRDNNRAMALEASHFEFIEGGSEKVRITSAGFVQIGAAADAAEAPLHVTAENSNGINAIFGAKDFVTHANYNYADANIALQGRDADDNDTGAGIQFTVRNTNNTNWLHGAITMDQSCNYIFKNGGAGTTVGSEKVRITSGGFVGIGTNSPAKALEVTSNTVPQFQVGMSNNSARASLMHNGSHLYFDTTSGDQVFRTGSTSERLRITSGGAVVANNIGIGTDNRWKIRPNTNNTELAFEYSTSTSLSDTNIKMALKSDSVDVLSDLSIQSTLAKISMIDTDGGDYFQLRNTGGVFTIRNSTDGRDDISITNNALTFGGVAKITDNNSIFFGNDNDIEMRHNATSSQNQIIATNHDFLLQSYGTIYMQCFQSGNSTNGNVLTANYNNGTALYYQNGERIVTTNAGCKISNGLVMNDWLNISKDGTYAPATVGHSASNHEGIFWHSAASYSIYRTAGSWSSPSYQQLRIDWPTGIIIAGGHQYGQSGCAFIDIANFKATSARPWGATFSSTSTNNSSRLFFEGTNHTANRTFSIMSEGGKLRISGGGNSSLYGQTGATGTQLVYLSSTSSTSWSSGSDLRLKENVTEIPNVLDKVKNYRCARFNFIGDDASDIQNIKFGFIAQDWVDDFPEVLSTSTQDADDPTDTTEYYGMQYTETIPVLLKAIQELNAKVETLEAKVATLEGS